MPDNQRPEVPAVGETFRRSLDATVTHDGARSTFVVTTGTQARDGMVLEPGGLSVDAYRRNPVILWQHGFDFQRGFLPIGKGANLRMEGDRWLADAEWAGDEFSQAIGDMVRGGYLNAVSIGWRTLDAGWETREGREVYVIRRAEMVEFSVVAVPADADALVTARAGQEADALRQMRQMIREEIARALPQPTEPEPIAEPTPAAEQPSPEPEEPQAPAPVRAATPEEIAAATAALLPSIQTAYNRALGRA